MTRNLLIDVAAFAGSGDVSGLQVVAKRMPKPGAPEKDTHGPGCYLHMEVGDAPGAADFGLLHGRAYEFARDMPGCCKLRDGKPLFEFPGVRVLDAQPALAEPRRNLILDIEEATASPQILGAVLVPKRGQPGFFVHCLLAHDDAMADDLTDAGLCACEFLQSVDPSMRREDGGPLHVFLGNEVHQVKPTKEVEAEPEPELDARILR